MGWLNCPMCNERFCLDDATEATLRRSSQEFHCPWGHSQHFPQGKSAEQKLREQLDEATRRAQRAEQRVAQKQDEVDYQERRARAFKGQTTRLRNRVKNGVCPCCNRTFANLQRHMANQHPAFTPEPDAPELGATTH